MNILLKTEISDYYKNFSKMYDDLLLVNKDVFCSGDKIIIESFGNTENSIWKHFRKIVESLDIPVFFIEVHTNDRVIDDFLNKNYVEKIDITFFDQQKIENHINNQFDYPDTICVNPFINLEVGNNGNYSPCCEYSGTIQNYNAKHHGFSEVNNSNNLREIRKSFLSGNWPSGCVRCKNLESFGKTSKRIRDNYYFRDNLFKINWREEKQNLISLDIKLGNACNLSCRICSAKASSSWYKEIKDNLAAWGLQQPPSVGLVDWPHDVNGVFWKSFEKIAEHIEYLQFVGGEPLMNKQHINILNFLVENSYSKNIHLHYNTNGTIWPSQKHFSIYENFKKVGISLSIDNLDKKFEYERYGNNWENVEKNIDNFLRLNKNHYKIDVYTTVSIFNVFDLPNIYKHFVDKQVDISFNLLDEPAEFSIRNIPTEERKNVINKILHDSKNTESYNFIIKILSDKNNYLDLNEKFFQHVNIVDGIRKQKFSDVNPEMYQIMKGVN